MLSFKCLKYILATLAPCLLLLASCDKYLDLKPDQSLVVPRTLDDLQAMLDDEPVMNQMTPGFSQTSDDDYFLTAASLAAMSDLDRGIYFWENLPYNYPNDWSYSYNAVYNANYCLEQVSKTGRTAANAARWDKVYGGAKFYRGYYFLGLAWQHAKAYDSAAAMTDLGIVLRQTSDFTVASTRAAVSETYRLIVEDLREAAAKLPELPEHPLRPSKAAAYGALARAFLSMGVYDSAFRYADLSLSLTSQLMDYNGAEVDGTSMTPFRPFNRETVFYSTQYYGYTPRVPDYALADTGLYRSYDADDLRRTAFFFDNQGYHSFKGSYAGDYYTFFSGITTAEMYLVRAECHCRSGRQAEALDDLNHLLSKRWAAGTFNPFADRGKTANLALILSERRKELLMRGLRWSDIKRLNKEGAAIIPVRQAGVTTYRLQPDDGRYALPLPQDIINIAGIPQN